MPFAPAVVRAEGAAHGFAWNRDGTVLVTGGLGGLGAAVARHLATTHGIRHLLLTGRRGPDTPQADRLRTELEGLGADVTIAACDAADRDAVAALLAGIPADRPLTAVVHTAGVLDDGLLTAQDPARLDAVLRPKTDAVRVLHELTRELDLDAFVLFSSAAGLFGSAGQATYAAANAYLDAFASWRHAQNLPATSLAWGPWAGDGMAGALTGADAARLHRSGLVALPPPQALALFDTACARPEPVLLPLRLDPAARDTDRQLPPLLRGHTPPPTRRPAAPEGPAPARAPLADRIAHLPRAERSALLTDLVRTEVATVLGHADPARITPEVTFKEAGFDSLTAVDLRNRLTAATGLRLTATLVFDHPTPQALADHLDQQLPGAEAAVLTLLGQLADATARADLDDNARQTVTARLSALIDGLGNTAAPEQTTAPEPGAPDPHHVTDLLRSASDDELFQLLDSGFRTA
ncbi:SDR family NAD(P)-dependent oxidoreductase [Streptomyces sp. NPDC050211]|uniref:type I polyketide synthase n=1 Tax=Streptomyces sp. NPDC050211 TaxID=3154932 RepID=UPI00341DD294